jgi:hypothetical protein
MHVKPDKPKHNAQAHSRLSMHARVSNYMGYSAHSVRISPNCDRLHGSVYIASRITAFKLKRIKCAESFE